MAARASTASPKRSSGPGVGLRALGEGSSQVGSVYTLRD